MDWSQFIAEALGGSWDMIKTVALIIFPLLIGIEVAEEVGILDKISSLFTPFLKHFRLSKEAGLPLIVAQIFGLTYGAGVILKEVREDKLNQRELMTLTVFLATCHAVFEDTLLFIAVGARPGVMLGTRLLLALGVTYFHAHYLAADVVQPGEARTESSLDN